MPDENNKTISSNPSPNPTDDSSSLSNDSPSDQPRVSPQPTVDTQPSAQANAPMQTPAEVQSQMSPPQVSSEAGAVVTGETPGAGRKFGGKKARRAIATILAILLLVGSVATGVFLVGQRQEIRIGAWDCSKYNFNVSQGGVVTATNGSIRNEPLQQAQVYINGELKTTFGVPRLNSGEGATLGTVDVPGASFSWRVVGTIDCKDSGSYEATPTPSPTPTLSPTPTPTPTRGPTPTVSPTPTLSPTPTATSTPTPTLPPEPTARCNDIKVFDTSWNQLSSSDLSALSPGQVVKFTVSGSTNVGSIDKARFNINGSLRPEVTQKRPGTDEYYDEYTISDGVTSFTVNAQVHHSSLGWF